MTLELDHVAVCAETLEEGVAYVEDLFGVVMSPGGSHPQMGTHNKLLSLGERIYLEVLAVDPDLPQPSHPRWFGLDHFTGPPRLVGWVARATVFERVVDMAPFGMNSPMTFSRGSYRWRMLLPDENALPFGGVGPRVIEWLEGGHPCDTLPDEGVRFRSLTVGHPDISEMVAQFSCLLSLPEANLEAAPVPKLVLEVDTPKGVCRLT